jgi:hypothetical protein
MSECQLLRQRASASQAVGTGEAAAWITHLRLESEMVMLITPVAGSLDSKTV